MATLYNTLQPPENGHPGFLLIVFTLITTCAWKTGAVLRIPGPIQNPTATPIPIRAV
jgi:hypothetical protein